MMMMMMMMMMLLLRKKTCRVWKKIKKEKFNSYYPIPPVTAPIVSYSVTGRYRPNNRSPVTESMCSVSSVNSLLSLNFPLVLIAFLIFPSSFSSSVSWTFKMDDRDCDSDLSFHRFE
jgi:hypothetical protein